MKSLSLFKDSDILIYEYKDEIDTLINQKLPSIQTFSWSFENHKANWQVKQQPNQRLEIRAKKESFALDLPFHDKASIQNVLNAMAILHVLKWTPDEIQQAVAKLKPVNMRLELKQAQNNSYLIDDSYNNDLAGLRIALDFLDLQDQRHKKSLILSDIFESGLLEKELYRQVASLVNSKKLHQLILIGQAIPHYSSLFEADTLCFKTARDFLESDIALQDQVFLIKGSRKFGLEQITRRYQSKSHGTRLEIDLDALTHNLNFYRSQLKPTVKLMVIVKAFAYGSGSLEVANLLQYHQVDYLSVAYPDEGVFLRENGIHLPIMVMNAREENFDSILTHDLEPEIYSFKQLSMLQAFLKERNQKMNIHLKIDTGMRRLGFDPKDMLHIAPVLDQERVKIVSVFSHLAGSDKETHDSFTHKQRQLFMEGTNMLFSILPYVPLRHILNSPGIIRFPHFQLDMVRLGIGLYGVESGNMKQSELMLVNSLKTTVAQVKKVPKGETIGYGREGIAQKDTLIATIEIGYADGFRRVWSNGVGEVFINGKKAPVMGNVCMDMCMIDVTGLEVHDGDEVEIFGENISILDLAAKINTIPYEILTNISERVKRVFFMD